VMPVHVKANGSAAAKSEFVHSDPPTVKATPLHLAAAHAARVGGARAAAVVAALLSGGADAGSLSTTDVKSPWGLLRWVKTKGGDVAAPLAVFAEHAGREQPREA